jgi:hypothetical protein
VRVPALQPIADVLGLYVVRARAYGDVWDNLPCVVHGVGLLALYATLCATGALSPSPTPSTSAGVGLGLGARLLSERAPRGQRDAAFSSTTVIVAPNVLVRLTCRQAPLSFLRTRLKSLLLQARPPWHTHSPSVVHLPHPTQRQKMPLNESQHPNARGVCVALDTGYNRAEGNRRA